ncbi:hypothetical protein GCM10011452_12000 [Gemmobacter lanyuensis]|uniref:Ferrochelatase n=1 Tax=Gemmobacter lanyuensis TaxID=1054497 RepID=A0A918IRP1_9RHOB|nr:hypothetical protein [Gemmobacter lanyuensis]GGW25709.1 hypothetical protein GCM10011452_12000 [Gemmobacter lanyuensis]
MKKLAALVAVASLASTAAFAGGPVVVAEEPAPAVAVAPASSGSLGGGAVLAGLAGLALVAALVANDSGDH